MYFPNTFDAALISWESSNFFNSTFWLNCPTLQAAFPTLHTLAIRDCVESESNVISSHQILWILLVWYANGIGNGQNLHCEQRLLFRKIEGDCTQGSQDPVELAKKLATFTHFKLARRENWCHIATRVDQIASAWTKVLYTKLLKILLFLTCTYKLC